MTQRTVRVKPTTKRTDKGHTGIINRRVSPEEEAEFRAQQNSASSSSSSTQSEESNRVRYGRQTQKTLASSTSVRVYRGDKQVPLPTTIKGLKGLTVAPRSEFQPQASYHTNIPPLVVRGDGVYQQFIDPFVDDEDTGIPPDSGYECFFDPGVIQMYQRGKGVRGPKPLPLVGDRAQIFRHDAWDFKTRRTIAALVESFNKYYELRG